MVEGRLIHIIDREVFDCFQSQYPDTPIVFRILNKHEGDMYECEIIALDKSPSIMFHINAFIIIPLDSILLEHE